MRSASYCAPSTLQRPPQAHLLHLGRPEVSKRVLITAPAIYASKLAALLIQADLRPVWLPAVATIPLTEPARQQDLGSALQDLAAYQHLAFTSRNGIVQTLCALQQLHGSTEAAVGAINASGAASWALGADVELLLEAGITNVCVPEEASTRGLVRQLAPLLQQGSNTASRPRVLCPVPYVSGGITEPPVVPRFLAGLQEAGAEVVRVNAYETTLGCTPEACTAERAMLEQGHIAAVAFSSTAEAQGLLHLIGGARVMQQAVQQRGMLLAAHGPYTASGVAAHLGLPVPCVSRDWSSFAGLVTALAEQLADAA